MKPDIRGPNFIFGYRNECDCVLWIIVGRLPLNQPLTRAEGDRRMIGTTAMVRASVTRRFGRMS